MRDPDKTQTICISTRHRTIRIAAYDTGSKSAIKGCFKCSYIALTEQLKRGKMASNDDVDFSSKFTVFNDRNEAILNIGLTQKKMMMIFLALLFIFFLVLVAFNAIESKDLVELKDLVKDTAKDLS